MEQNLKLLSAPNCCLCRKAKQQLQQMAITFEEVNIQQHPEWLQEYALKIPVLLNTQSDGELCWPFDDIKLYNFTNKNSGD